MPLSSKHERLRARQRQAATHNALALTAAALGCTVDVRLDDGTVAARTLTAHPWQTGSGDWICGLSGISGGYCCSRVTPAK